MSELHDLVVFPIGFMGYPDKNFTWCRVIGDVMDSSILKSQLERQQTLLRWPGGGLNKLPPGQPIFVFPSFTLDQGWQLTGEYEFVAHSMNPEPVIKVSPEYFDVFLEKRTKLCLYFEQAGVCYFDMRLTNILFRIVGDKLELKVIDFDYSQFLNEPLDPGFKKIATGSAHFPSDIHIASSEWHAFMLNKIKSKIVQLQKSQSNDV